MTKKTPKAPKPQPAKRPVLEECAVNDASDSDIACEEPQLPPASGKNQWVSGTREAGGVRPLLREHHF